MNQQELEREGFAILPCVLGPDRVADLVSDLERVLAPARLSVLRSRGCVYGVRNLIDVWPAALEVARENVLRGAVHDALGAGFDLIRSIFFDKPPGRTWSLPWHRDLTIAVRQADIAVPGFGRPTVKAGVPHVEAPASLLQRMLTVRIALDDVTPDNGPLLVVPGSHHDVRKDLPSKGDLASRAHPVHLGEGDALLIRPLVVHRSGPSRPGTSRNRRTLHFEFAADASLPGGLAWHRFVPMAP